MYCERLCKYIFLKSKFFFQLYEKIMSLEWNSKSVETNKKTRNFYEEK